MNAFFSKLLATWQTDLSPVFDEREAKNTFLFALEDCFQLSKTQLISENNLQLSEEALAQLQAIKTRLLAGEPYQYIIGFTYFDGLKIQVNADVLIPRPETEELVDWITTDFKNETEIQLVDWCTGSGCIALAVKARHPNWTITGIDVSAAALAIAQQNASANNLVVSWINDDLQQSTFQQSCTVIVSNPPYIPLADKQFMAKNVLEFEPHLALFVPDEDPLLFYRLLAENAKKQLVQNGCIYLEIHEDYAVEMKALLSDFGFTDIEIRNDLQGKSRMLKAVNKTV